MAVTASARPPRASVLVLDVAVASVASAAAADAIAAVILGARATAAF